MFKIHRYIYYRLYIWNLKSFGERDLPALNALLELSLIIYVNILTIILIIDEVFIAKTIDRLISTQWLAIIMVVFVLLIQYLFLFHKNRHKKIIERYENDQVNGKRNEVLAFLYVGISIIFFHYCHYVITPVVCSVQPNEKKNE